MGRVWQCTEEIIANNSEQGGQVSDKEGLVNPYKSFAKSSGLVKCESANIFHSVLLVYKVSKNQTPEYLHKMFDSPYSYDTRQARGGKIRLRVKLRLELGKNSFGWRGANQFNQLPDVIRASPSLLVFKTQAKKWISMNVSIQ